MAFKFGKHQILVHPLKSIIENRTAETMVEDIGSCFHISAKHKWNELRRKNGDTVIGSRRKITINVDLNKIIGILGYDMSDKVKWRIVNDKT